MSKICTGECETLKTLDCFSKNKNNKDGYMSICKQCRSLKRKTKKFDKKKCDKKCLKCNKVLSSDHFYVDKSMSDGMQTYCKNCRKDIAQKYYKDGGSDVYFKHLYNDLLNNAKKRNIPVNISIDDVKNLYDKQNGCCAISRIRMTTTYVPGQAKWSKIHNVSVDRINSSEGYTVSNIQLVCAIVNTMKWDLKQSDFIDICKIIANVQITSNNDPQEILPV